MTDHQAEFERIWSWARYVFYTEVECQQYDVHAPAEDEPTFGRCLVLMLQFYAALWVAVDGWRECGLADETVDELLSHPAFKQNVELLRRLRNGTYHYQPDLINERVLAFMKECEQTVPWALLLHWEFKRVVWESAHPSGASSEVESKLADALRDIVGWLLADISEALPQVTAEKYGRVTEMILRSSDRDAPHSRKLLEATDQLRVAASEAKAGWAQRKRAIIESLKRQWQPRCARAS